MKKNLYYLSISGVIFIILYTLVTLFSTDILIFEEYHLTFHLYVMAVFIISLITAGKKSKKRNVDFKAVMKGKPKVLKYLFYFSLIYATLILLIPKEGMPEKMGDSYSMVHRGQVLENLTKEEYEKQLWMQKRISTGPWLVFLSAAAFLMYTPKNNLA